MDRSLVILAVCKYVESHIKTGFAHEDLEAVTGFSYAHLRQVFRRHMGVPLARYILRRRLSYVAFDLAHTDGRIIDIAYEYGFRQYDPFTRAFKRETGVLPSVFRRQRMRAGRKMVAVGLYAPAMLEQGGAVASAKTEVVMNQMTNTQDSCILLGVPKVEYLWGECTPFPSCLKACLNYMGQDVGYAFLMAASGAAFRLRWNLDDWDGGNVDISYIYKDENEPFARSFAAAGRSYRLLQRTADTTKEEFFGFIKAEIDSGRPVIAKGIIGPPEACIVTGYQDGGKALLGWNFFQQREEYSSGIRIHESGYFIADAWWENECTNLLMAIGEEEGGTASDRDILQNALEITNREPIVYPGGRKGISCGQQAYKAWADKISDDKEFAPGMVLPVLFEKYMCQSDAQTMVGEGRYYAAKYVEEVAGRHPQAAEKCKKIAELFMKASTTASTTMYQVIGDGEDPRKEQYETMVRNYAKPEVRAKLVPLVEACAAWEQQAMDLMAELLKNWPEA